MLNTARFTSANATLITVNVPFRKYRTSMIGFSACSWRRVNTTKAAAEITALSANTAGCRDWFSASRKKLSATASNAPPAASNFSPVSVRGALGMVQASRKAAAAIGARKAQTADHPKRSSNKPNTDGPSALPRPNIIM